MPRSYLCICKKDYSGRRCEIELKTSQDPIRIPQRILKINSKPASDSTTTTTTSTSTTSASTTSTLEKHVPRVQNRPVESTHNFKHLTSTSVVKNSRPKNPCLTGKCQNNGTCVMSFSHAKNRFSFVCKCNQGHYGDLCEKTENACEPNPCTSMHKQCISLGYQKYECVCASGEDCGQKKDTTPNQSQTNQDFPQSRTTAETQKLTIVNSFSTSRPLGKVKHTTQPVTQQVPVLVHDSSFRYPIEMVPSKEAEEKEEIDLGTKNIYSKKKMIHFLKKKLKMQTQNSICKSDEDLCLKYPYGNDSFICVKSFITQEYTVCLPTKAMNCKETNPCLNGGVCVDNFKSR